MDESERLQRYRREYDKEFADEDDARLAERIAALLNHAAIDKYCMVDAYYYDFSVIPHEIQEKLNLWRDVYLIFGITTKGEIISKWVDRWDLNSSDEIIDGKLIPSKTRESFLPVIREYYDPKLLSVPTPDLMKMFGNPPTL